MKTELKPCPFCGPQTREGYGVTLREVRDITSADKREHYDIGYEVECVACGVSVHGEYQSEAVNAWNTRDGKAPSDEDAQAAADYDEDNDWTGSNLMGG